MAGGYKYVIFGRIDKPDLYMSEKDKNDQQPAKQVVLISADETERLRRDIYRSDMEKLQLFTQMLRTNSLLKKVKVTHK